MLNFYFLEKGLGIVFPQYFVFGFSRKMFLMSCSINDTHGENFLFYSKIVLINSLQEFLAIQGFYLINNLHCCKTNTCIQ